MYTCTVSCRIYIYIYEYIIFNSTHSYYMNDMMTLDSMYMGVGLEALFSWYLFAIYIYIFETIYIARHIISTFVQISINISTIWVVFVLLWYCTFCDEWLNPHLDIHMLGVSLSCSKCGKCSENSFGIQTKNRLKLWFPRHPGPPPEKV